MKYEIKIAKSGKVAPKIGYFERIIAFDAI